MKVAIFDLNRTLYDPETDALLPGAIEVLTELKNREYVLFLVSKNEPERGEILKRFAIESFFKSIYLVKEKALHVFFGLIVDEKITTDDVYVVGDVMEDEIRFANQCELRTVWLQRGKFAWMTPKISADKPWKTISELPELLSLLPC